MHTMPLTVRFKLANKIIEHAWAAFWHNACNDYRDVSAAEMAAWTAIRASTLEAFELAEDLYIDALVAKMAMEEA